MALDLNKHVARVLFVVHFIVILLLSRTLLSIAAIYLLHAMCAAVAADADYVFTQLQEQALEEQAQALSAHIQQAALHQALYKVHKARNWRSRSCPCLFCQGSRCKTNSMPTKRSRSPARTVIVRMLRLRMSLRIRRSPSLSLKSVCQSRLHNSHRFCSFSTCQQSGSSKT